MRPSYSVSTLAKKCSQTLRLELQLENCQSNNFSLSATGHSLPPKNSPLSALLYLIVGHISHTDCHSVRLCYPPILLTLHTYTSCSVFQPNTNEGWALVRVVAAWRATVLRHRPSTAKSSRSSIPPDRPRLAVGSHPVEMQVRPSPPPEWQWLHQRLWCSV